MGKKSGTPSSSWLTAVKRAFRSPNKDSDKKSSRRKVDHQQQEADEEDKKREKRRWLFRRQSHKGTEVPSQEVNVAPAKSNCTPQLFAAEQRHAIAVAAATAAAAEAAVATAKAAVEIIRLTQPSTNASASAANVKQHSAATLIQTAFRGYLARRALIALKGIVKLQALIRGEIVRRQANMTMKCMQALFRVQARVRDQRARLSHDRGRKSMFAESTNLWESKYLKDIRARNSRSREGSYDWAECPRTLQELEAIVKARNEASFAHERSLAFAFQQQNQIIDSDRIPYERDICELEEEKAPTRFLDQRLPSKPWEDNDTGRASTDFKREPIKTVEIDTLKPANNTGRRSRAQSPIHPRSHYHNEVRTIQSPITPSFGSRPRPSQVRSASPRCPKEDRSHSAANTPSLRMRTTGPPRCSTGANNHPSHNDGIILPNYMAATESAKARIRSQSAPRQRPCTPDRAGNNNGGASSAKKRLSYPIPEPYCVNFGFGFDGSGRDLRSPSFKSVQVGYVGMEENAYYAESVVGGEISPCSTTDLRRWLR